MPNELADVTLRTVDTVDEADEFLRWLSERRPILSIDTETTGLKWWTPNFLRLVQFGDARTGWTISARRWLGVAEEALTRLRDDHTPVVFHNASFDLHALESADLPLPDLRHVHDTKLMHHLWRNDLNHSLKPISERRFGQAATLGQRLLDEGKAKNKWDWATVPEWFVPYSVYAAMDTVLTARLAEELWQDTPDKQYDREMAVQLLMWRAERRGLRIDPVYTDLLREEWVREAAQLREELREYGLENPSSGKQVAFLLEEGGWEPQEWTETGLPKLDKDVYKELVKATGLTAEVAERVVRYKRLVKWVGTYLDTFMRDRDATDHLHASINTMQARTGRMSITGPPLQTLPRGPEIRNAVVPEEGEALWSIDYDAQELRLFAHYSGEAGLIQAIAEGKDMHAYAASMAYQRPYESIGKDDPERQVAKNVQYARLYGAGPERMAKTAGVSEQEIVHFLNAYDRAFPDVSRFMDQVEGVGRLRHKQDGRPWVETWGGRRLGVEEDKVYSLVNYLIQGSCADLLKVKLLALDAAGLGDRIVLPVHDEVLFSFPEDEGEEMTAEACRILSEYEAFDVPLPVTPAGPSPSWGATGH